MGLQGSKSVFSVVLSVVVLLSLLLGVCPGVGVCPALAKHKADGSADAQPDDYPAEGERSSKPEGTPLKFTGAIIRYDRPSMELGAEQWQQILENLTSLGIDTIIIHNHHYLPRLSTTGQTVEELDFIPADAVASAPARPGMALPTAVKKGSATATKSTAAKSTAAKTLATKKAGYLVVGKKTATLKSAPGKYIAGNDKSEAETGKIVLIKAKFDATGYILDYADKHGMKVFMGLRMDQNWFSNLDVTDQLAHTLSRSKYDLGQLKKELTDKKSDTTRTASDIKDAELEIAVCERGLITVQHELEEKSQFFSTKNDGQFAAPCMKLADKLEKLYGNHASFAGWYLPEEIWDAAFSAETISVLNPLLKLLSTYCQSISPPGRERPFAMTPKSSRLHYDSVDEIYASHLELLRDTGVDILMLEDSIGDLNLIEDEDIAVRLKKHFTAFSRVAAALKMKLWAELETFEQQGTVRKPTNLGRLKKQFQYSYAYLDKEAPHFIAYDYLRFMSLTATKFPNPELRSKLFDDYKRDFIDSPFIPQ